MAAILEYFGTFNGWLYFFAPLLLGLLHGIEPRHSSAFAQGAFQQSIWLFALPGLSAAITHTLLIWFMTAVATQLGASWNFHRTQPWFELAASLVLFALAAQGLYKSLNHQRRIHRESSAFDASRLNAVFSAKAIWTGALAGLMPCPLTVGVLLTCFKSGKPAWGMVIAIFFGLGLALTMATSGSVAAWFTARARALQLNLDGMRQRIARSLSILLFLLAGALAWRAIVQFSVNQS